MSTRKLLFFSTIISLLILVETICTLFISGIYRDPEIMVIQATGQDFFTLLFMLPCFIVSAVLTSRGKIGAKVFLMGVMLYLVYTYTGFAILAHFNTLFLVYIALISFSGYMLICLFLSIDLKQIDIAKNVNARLVSLLIIIIVSLFYTLWLSEIIPALITGQVPKSIAESNTSSNPVFILDLACIFPFMVFIAFKLWSRNKIGILFAGVILVYDLLMISTVECIMTFMYLSKHTIVIPKLVILIVIFVMVSIALIRYFRNIKTNQSNENVL